MGAVDDCNYKAFKLLADYKELPDEATCNMAYIGDQVDNAISFRRRTSSPEMTAMKEAMTEKIKNLRDMQAGLTKAPREEIVETSEDLYKAEDEYYSLYRGIRLDLQTDRQRILALGEVPRYPGMTESEICQAEIADESKRELENNLKEWRRGNDREIQDVRSNWMRSPKANDSNGYILNNDQSCSVITAATAILKLQDSHWLGDDEASLALAKFRVTPQGEVPDLAEFRVAVSPQYERFERMLINWFPPRLFLKAMIEAMPTLKQATSFSRLVGDTAEPQNILDIVYSEPATLEQLLEENEVRFATLPTVLIVHTGLHGALADLDFKYPEILDLKTESGGDSKRYALKAVSLSATYHSNIALDNTFIRDSERIPILSFLSGEIAPDLLIYEEQADQSGLKQGSVETRE
jgi:hypothetical protein